MELVPGLLGTKIFKGDICSKITNGRWRKTFFTISDKSLSVPVVTLGK
jgi:hypothetical protein